MAFLEITRKDLLLLVRDRRALVVLLLLPMAFICILGLSTGQMLGWRNDNQLLNIGVVDRSGSRQASLIIDRMQAIDGIKASPILSLSEAEQLLNDRDITAAVIIGEDFESCVEALTPQDMFDVRQASMKITLADVDVKILSRPAGAMVRSVVDQLVLFCMLQAVLPDSARRSEVRSRVQDLIFGNPDSEAEAGAGSPQGEDSGKANSESRVGESESVSREATLLSENSSAAPTNAESAAGNPVYQTLVPAYTVMFAFFLVPIMGRSFIEERQLGTLRRLQIAPISSVDLVLGKTLPFLIISLVQSSVLFLFGRLLFGMSWGTYWWLLIPIVTCTSLAATGMGLLVATLVRTDSQVSAYANFLVITLAGISGCFMPRDWLPELMQNVSLGTPHAWSLIAYHEALTTLTPRLAEIAKACGVLTLFAAVFASLGCWKMQHSRD
jgi:ABC-2 type transport system permease protein